jgi:hypothetical protein
MAASKSPRLRLLHMRDEIDSLSNELAGLGFGAYRESYGLRRITERAIQIVSEAARALPEELRARHPKYLGPTSSPSAIRCGMNIIASTIRSYGKPPPSTCRSCNRLSNRCLPSSKTEYLREALISAARVSPRPASHVFTSGREPSV